MGRGRSIIMASVRTFESSGSSSSEEGRRSQCSRFEDERNTTEQVEIVGGGRRGGGGSSGTSQQRQRLKQEKKESAVCCCPIFLCLNCTPLRLRINTVGLLLIIIFCFGCSLGILTRPVVPNYESGTMTGSDSGNNSNNGNIFEQNKSSKFLVGVYYYPWHGSDFHRGDGYMRKELLPPQAPVLGEYDDTKPETIAQHLKWSREANIGLWVTSWWGPNTLEDITTRDVILDHEDLGDMKIALHYESAGRIKDSDLSNVASDISFICERYFDHPNYYRIDGRPVIVLYITRYFQEVNLLDEMLLIMRNSANRCGHEDLFIIGDHVFGESPDVTIPDNRFLMLDAVTNYDVYGSMGRPEKYATARVVDRYYDEQEKWKKLAHLNDCKYIPGVSPGYNDRGVRFEKRHPPLSRKLTIDSEEGSLFRYQLQKALPLTDPMVDNLVLVNSFNEWHEDTQIEPVATMQEGVSSSLPISLTGGLSYEGYGNLYLDILRESTTTPLRKKRFLR